MRSVVFAVLSIVAIIGPFASCEATHVGQLIRQMEFAGDTVRAYGGSKANCYHLVNRLKAECFESCLMLTDDPGCTGRCRSASKYKKYTCAGL